MTRVVDWSTKGLRINKLELIAETNSQMLKVVACYGVVKSDAGEEFVLVDLPFDHLPQNNPQAAIVAHAQNDRIHAHATGILAALTYPKGDP